MPNSTGQRSHDLGENESRQRLLEGKLRELEEVFERTMRARGFDPQQIENVPLTPALARLQAEREELMDELAELRNRGTGDKGDKNEGGSDDRS